MKKRISMQLGAVLSLSILLTACGGGNSASSSKAEGNSDSQSAANGKKTNISWFLSTGVVPSTWDESQYVMKTITEATGVTVSATTPAEDAATKLNLMIANGKLPDIITIDNQTLIKDMIDADLVWNMEDFFKTYMPDSHLLSSFPKDVKEKLVARDGAWYTLPSHMLSPDNREIWGLNPATKDLWLSTDYRENRGFIFNKDLMDKLGIKETDVRTESGLLATLEKVKQANLTVDGGSVYTVLADGNSFNGSGWKSDAGALGALTMSFGGMPVDKDGNYQSMYYNDQFKHALKYLNTFAQKGYVDANQFTMDRAAREAACRSGRVFCFIGNTADAGFYDKANNGFEFYTPGVVLSDSGETPVLGHNGTVGRGWLQNLVAKNTKNPEAVAKFLDYMSSEEGLKIWNYGETGVDSETNDKGLIVRTDAGTKKANNAAVTGLGAFWSFCNQNFDQKFMDPSIDFGIIPQCAYGTSEKTYKYDTAAIDELPGSYIESNTDMLAITTEVKSYAGTELANIILQATDSDFDARYEAMIKQLKTLGLPDLDAYINKAVQENYKTMGYTLKPKN